MLLFAFQAKKKDSRHYAAFFISDKKQALWNMSVHEAETLMREPKRLRIDVFYDMLEKPKTKVTPKSQKSGKISRTDSDVSLSESLLDTLFSEGDRKTDDLDRSRNKSLDVSEVVTACLDNMAAKTGITKIQRQSHMDRWLQKAKSKTPEKNQLKVTVTVERIEKGKDKLKGKEKDINTSEFKKKKNNSKETTYNPSPYSFRKSVRESQNLLSHQNEHDYSKYSECEDAISLKTHNVDAIQTAIEPVQNNCVIDKGECLNENINEIIGKDYNKGEIEVVNKVKSISPQVETTPGTDQSISRRDSNLNEGETRNNAQYRVDNKEVLETYIAESKDVAINEITNSMIIGSDQPIDIVVNAIEDVVNAIEMYEKSKGLQVRDEQSINREKVGTEEEKNLENRNRDFETTIKGECLVKYLENNLEALASDKENTEISKTQSEKAVLGGAWLCEISSEKMDVDENIHENVVDGKNSDYEHLDMLYANLENGNDITNKSCVKVKNQEVVHKSDEVIGVTLNNDAQNYTFTLPDSANDLLTKTNDKDFVSQVIEKNEVYSKTINEHTVSRISCNDLTEGHIENKTANSTAEIISVNEDATDYGNTDVSITADVAKENTFLADIVNTQIESIVAKNPIITEMSTDDDITDCESISASCNDAKINTVNKSIKLDNSVQDKEPNNLCDFEVKKDNDCFEDLDIKNTIVNDSGTVSNEKTKVFTNDEHKQIKVEIAPKNINKSCDIDKSSKSVKEFTKIEENGYEDDYSEDDCDIEQPVYSPHCPESEEKVNLITEGFEIVTQQNLNYCTVLLSPLKNYVSTNQILPRIANVTCTSTRSKKPKDLNETKTEFESDNDSMSSELDNIALSELQSAFKNKTLQNDGTKFSKEVVSSKASNSDTEVFPKRELRSRISKSPSSSIKENGFHSSKDTSPERVAKQEYDTISIISINSEDSNTVDTSVSKRKLRKERQVSVDNMHNPEFLKYMELRRDSLMDEHPELSNEELVAYLYKTWQYEDSKKSDLMKNEDMESSHLVKGVTFNQELSQPKKKKLMKQRKIVDIVKVIGNEDFKPREKRKIIEPLYKEDFSDLEDEIEMFEIFKPKNKLKLEIVKIEPFKAPTDNIPKIMERTEDDKETSVENKQHDFISDIEEENYDEEEAYFEQLTKPKPNVFKGMVREKVCDVCEKTSNLVKCKGCQSMFHIDCINKKSEDEEVPMQSARARKKNKKKRGRKPKVSTDSNGVDSGSQSDEKSHEHNVSEELNMSVENVKEREVEPLVVDADNLEAQLEAKMRELVNSDNVEYESYSSDDGIDWDKTVAGQCEIVEIKLKHKPMNIEVDYSDFKCKHCLEHEVPICFVCKSAVSPKDKNVRRQKCQVAHCQKYYHISCLDQWPQTQFNSGEPSRNNKKINEHFEALTCPRHVCHTCVCDDPRGCKTRFSSDKLARCVRCPATYHSFTKCLPAGTKILTASHIICPRHYEHR